MPAAQPQEVEQARTTEMPKRWPLVSPLDSRTSVLPFNVGARIVNGYAELDPYNKEYEIYKRPGISTSPFFSFASNPGQGMYTDSASGAILSVSNSQLNDHATPQGALTSTLFNSYFFESIASSPHPTIAISNGSVSKSYLYTPFTNTLALIAGGITSNNGITPGFVYLDGTLYFMDYTGAIWGSNLNNAAAWNPLNVIQASAAPDLGVGLAKQLSYIVAFKQWTTSIFYDAGNPSPGSPLSPVPDSLIPLGCLDGNSIQNIDDTLIWVTFGKKLSPQVARLDNLTPTIISTPSIDRLLVTYAYTGVQLGGEPSKQGIQAYGLKYAGHRLYILTLLSLNMTLVYDLDQQLWYLWTDPNGNFWPISGIGTTLLSSTQPTTWLVQSSVNGSVYSLSEANNIPSDFGTLYPMDIYTSNLDFGVMRRKHLKALYFNGDKINTKLQVRFSDDDYQTWSNFRTVDMNLKKPRLTDCGTFKRRRAYHIRHLGNSGMRLASMDMQMDIGTQ